MFKPSEPVLPDTGNIINLSGPQRPVFVKGKQGVTIEIDYEKICLDVLRKCKRTPEGLITDEYLIQCFMQLTREEDIDGEPTPR